MRIPCPFCGDRDVGEFFVLGSAELQARPDADAPDAVQRFAAYVYSRANPAGAHEELWYHSFGCRSWLVVKRDTLSHAVEDVRHASATATGAR